MGSIPFWWEQISRLCCHWGSWNDQTTKQLFFSSWILRNAQSNTCLTCMMHKWRTYSCASFGPTLFEFCLRSLSFGLLVQGWTCLQHLKECNILNQWMRLSKSTHTCWWFCHTLCHRVLSVKHHLRTNIFNCHHNIVFSRVFWRITGKGIKRTRSWSKSWEGSDLDLSVMCVCVMWFWCFFQLWIFFAEMGLWFGKMAHYVREAETCGSALPSFGCSLFWPFNFRSRVRWKREFLSSFEVCEVRCSCCSCSLLTSCQLDLHCALGLLAFELWSWQFFAALSVRCWVKEDAVGDWILMLFSPMSSAFLETLMMVINCVIMGNHNGQTMSKFIANHHQYSQFIANHHHHDHNHHHQNPNHDHRHSASSVSSSPSSTQIRPIRAQQSCRNSFETLKRGEHL